MKMMLLLVLLISLFCLILLQTNRSIYLRSMGLFLIFACSLLVYIGTSANYIGKLILLTILMGMGFFSDYYAASLRTWYFRVTAESLWGVVIGSFIGLILWPFFNTLAGFLLGSLLGAFIGEIRTYGYRSTQRVFKSTLGACAGIFGMSVKLLLGIEMIYWLLPDISRSASL